MPDNASATTLFTMTASHVYNTGLTCGYDGDGLRAWKQNDGGTRTYFLYDGTDPVCEMDSSGTVSATNTFGAQGLLSRRVTNTSTFYTFDERGNLAQRTSAAGGSVGSANLYDGFGRRVLGTQDMWGFGAQWGAYTDGETGLVLMTHRFYDPQVGRFVTRDPMGYDGGVNLYSYTRNNPINRVDPSGLMDADFMYSYWMNTAVDGESAGGVVGTSQAAGASLMAAFVDFIGARNVQRESAASGDASGNGETGAAIVYGTAAGLEILASASVGWTGGGGAGAVGVGFRDIGWYERGSRTINGKIFGELEEKGLTEDKVMLGKILAKNYKGRELRPGFREWFKTVPKGPTPGGYAGLQIVAHGGHQFLRGHCPE